MQDDFRTGRHRAAMTPPFMLQRRWPATAGERSALLSPARLPPPRRGEQGEPDARTGRGR